MTSNPKKILILLTTSGGGHVSISNALKQFLNQDNSNHQVKTLDTSGSFSSATYRFIGEYFLDFTQKNWQSSNNPQASKTLHSIYSPLVVPKIIKAIKSFKPDMIITTCMFATMQLELSLSQLNLSTPHLVVIADPFSIHHCWTTYKKADHYLVPTLETKKILIQRNIPSSKITVTGLPLRLSIFNPPLTQVQAKKALNLDLSKKTIFIGGSGEGHGQIYKIVSKLIKNESITNSCQLLVVAGKNKLLLSKLKKLFKKHPHSLKYFGYTDIIDTLLTASDLVVGKAGPNILFEALMLKKLFITTSKALPQEMGNYQYIKNNQLGIVTHDHKNTINEIIRLINNPSLVDNYSPAINKHYKKYLNTPQKTLKVINHFL